VEPLGLGVNGLLPPLKRGGEEPAGSQHDPPAPAGYKQLYQQLLSSKKSFFKTIFIKNIR